MPFATVAHAMTRMPADAAGLEAKGRISAGLDADFAMLATDGAAASVETDCAGLVFLDEQGLMVC